MLGSEARGNKTKEMYYSLLSLEMISFVLFPQASQPSLFSATGFPKIANFTGKLWDGLLFPRQLIRGNSCTARVYKFFVHQPLLLITSVFFANSKYLWHQDPELARIRRSGDKDGKRTVN